MRLELVVKMAFIDTQQIQHRNFTCTTNSARWDHKSNSYLAATKPMRCGTSLMVEKKTAAVKCRLPMQQGPIEAYDYLVETGIQRIVL